MAIYTISEILGFHFSSGDVVCWDCATEQERNSPLQSELIVESGLEGTNDYYFCDRCDRQVDWFNWLEINL